MSLLTASHHPPLALSADDTVEEACRQMQDNNVGAVAIINSENRPVGIFTERDALQKIIVGSRDATDTKLSEVMTSPCIVIPSDRTVDDALSVMLSKTIFHLAVVDDSKKLVGIVSYRTLVRDRIETLNAEVDGLSAYMGVDGIGGD